VFPFSALCGQEEMKLALLLVAINPRLKGVLLTGEKGTGKSTAARALSNLLDLPFVNLPLAATEEALLGGIDFSAAFRGEKKSTRGLLTKAHRGVLYVDEINLLPPHLLVSLLNAPDQGAFRLEREGLSEVFEADFVLLGSMNPEEGLLPPQILDRFGLCVLVESEKDPETRVEILKRRLSYEKDPESFKEAFAPQEEALKGRLLEARKLLSRVRVPARLKILLGHLASEASPAGNRAEIFLLEATKAHAALSGREEAELGDLEAVAEMVLRHRRRIPQEKSPPPPKKKKPQEKREKEAQNTLSKPEAPSSEAPKTGQPDPSEASPRASSPAGTRPREGEEERLFPVGEIFAVRDLSDPSARPKMTQSFGRGERALTLVGRGHYLRPVPYQGQGEMALYATLLAAARRRAESGHTNFSVEPQDLRAKLKLTKTSKLLLFCVDGSGSMAAEARMKETKGAIMGLLLSAYQRRYQAALMVFRHKEARLVLPPTSSVEFAGKILENLTVGGSTPLSLALAQLGTFLEKRRRQFPQEQTTVILVTDGRGNVSLFRQPVKEEIAHLAEALRYRFPEVQFLVVDTETGPVRLEMARRLASWLGARYFTPETLRAERLAEVARESLRKGI